MTKKVYGIDLGTTYSAISTLDDNSMPEIIENYADSIPLLASAVYFPEDGDPVIGKEAKNQAEVEPDRVVQYVKREIGKSDALERTFNGVKYNPILISALILKRMKEYAAEQGHDVQEVVITCPAYFGNEERDATKQAGIIAGLNVLNIVNEPTAAALNYCCREFKENRKMMVYDLGGGTFDITLFDFSVDDDGKASVDVIETGGDDQLGGIDWDARLYDYICELYGDENGISQDEMDAELRQKIRSTVEDVKKAISNMSTRSFTINHAGDVTRLEVTREQFEEKTQDLVERTVDFVCQILQTAHISPDEIDIVLLVGGSTKMPMIKAAVEKMFPGDGRVRIEQPDLAVAKGAALAAAIEWNERIIRGEIDKFTTSAENQDTDSLPPISEAEISALKINVPQQVNMVKDKLSRSFGAAVIVDEEGNYMIDNLLFVGDDVPSEATQTYGTAQDGQEAIEVYVYENVSRDRENKYVTPSFDQEGNEQYTDPALKVKRIGKVRLGGLPLDAPKGYPIQVFFRVSTIGVEVQAKDITTNKTATATLSSENILSKEELKQTTTQIAMIKTTGNI